MPRGSCQLQAFGRKLLTNLVVDYAYFAQHFVVFRSIHDPQYFADTPRIQHGCNALHGPHFLPTHVFLPHFVRFSGFRIEVCANLNRVFAETSGGSSYYH